MQLFSIWDRKAMVWKDPICVAHLPALMRSLSRAMNSPENPVAEFAEDFELYRVGFFNNESGEITPVNPPEFVEQMANIKAMKGGEK